MNDILKRSIRDFKRELNAAIRIAQSKEAPPELELFKVWLNDFYAELSDTLDKLEYYVSLNDPEIHKDTLDRLSTAVKRFRLVNTRYLPGFYRGNENDRLALKVIKWLHDQHEQTRKTAFVIMDGNFAIYSALPLPASYYLPIPSQQSLLFMPLFFHEIGHYLYSYHKMEMDELVKELQIRLENHLAIPTRQNDKKFNDLQEKNKKILENWYEWVQELFCDAVGLEIGGKTYLKAFSYYLRMLGRDSFYISEKELLNSGHPVTWLRINFLVERAEKLGLADDARELREEWIKIARTLKVKEDYFGFYDEDYHQDIQEILDYMIEEASPIRFSNYTGDGETDANGQFNVIKVMHEAWDKFENSNDDFEKWEIDLISELRS
ncbi:hypothetical protein [Mucilaginibacter phyllosphaerae]